MKNKEITFEELPQAVSYLIEKVESLEKVLQNNEEKRYKTENRWFNIDELIDYLPDKPAKATVYGWVSTRQIPYHKGNSGKRLRFLQAEIDEWLFEGKRKTESEFNEEALKFLERKGRH